MEQRVRICDIAEELGLSTATVSNVIHGKTNKVSDETVQRVTALLEERQYIPSMAGILLARNSSKIIGVFVNDHEKYEGHTLDDFFIASSIKNYFRGRSERTDLPRTVYRFAGPDDDRQHARARIRIRSALHRTRHARRARHVLQQAPRKNGDGCDFPHPHHQCGDRYGTVARDHVRCVRAAKILLHAADGTYGHLYALRRTVRYAETQTNGQFPL